LEERVLSRKIISDVILRKQDGWVAVDRFFWFRIREVAEYGNRPLRSMK